jgi:sulfotransferase famil protein
MLLSLEKNFLFVHVPKTGGTSIARSLDPWILHPPQGRWNKLLCRMHLRRDPQRFMLRVHGGVSYASKVLPNHLFEKTYKFAFVRNPWDRLVSEYSFVLDKPHHPRYKEVRLLADFGEYLRYEKERARGRSQADMLRGPKGEMAMDFVGRFEQLTDDFAQVCQKLQIDASLPHLNRTHHRDFREYYNSADRAYVTKNWRDEIELFGYEF